MVRNGLELVLPCAAGDDRDVRRPVHTIATPAMRRARQGAGFEGVPASGRILRWRFSSAVHSVDGREIGPALLPAPSH